MTEAEKLKLEKLKNIFIEAGSAAIAFSGGVDSTFLAKVAHDVLGEKMICLTLVSHTFPKRERDEASEFCKSENIPQIEIEYDQLSIPGFRENPKDRCYHCKKEIFSKIKSLANEKGMAIVAEGSNADDTGDYRPGMIAIRELGIKSPLLEAGLTKAEIRNLSKEMNLPTWDKPSLACLATRIAYGETITAEKLSSIQQAEHFLFDLGFKQLRVRMHGTLARIELLPEDIESFMKKETRNSVSEKFRELGFTFVTLDLQGFRSGSMNSLL